MSGDGLRDAGTLRNGTIGGVGTPPGFVPLVLLVAPLFGGGPPPGGSVDLLAGRVRGRGLRGDLVWGVVFALAHLGYFPVSAWPLPLVAGTFALSWVRRGRPGPDAVVCDRG